MAAPAVHQKTGRQCYLCGKTFDAKSFTIPISYKEPKLIVKHLVCGPCHHEFHAKGE